MRFVRPPAVAGSFYPADPIALATDIRHMLDAVAPPFRPAPKALIAPHAGYIYSGPIAASAYGCLTPARQTITRVVLIGPAHRVAFSGVAVSSADAFQTPLGTVPLDRQGAEQLRALAGVVTLDEAHEQEHSLEVHLPFLQSLLDHFTLLPLVVGAAPDALVAALLEQVWGGAETLVVVSSDLSHYLDYEAARRRDRATLEAILRYDAGAFDHHGACGRAPLGGLLLLAKQRGLTIESLDLRNSGDTAGPRDRVVGYGAWRLSEPENQTIAQSLLRLARQAIQRRFSNLPDQLTVPADPRLVGLGASFVTLHQQGQLRGCIGSPTAWRGLAEDVAENAVRAAFADPRFPPLSQAEWPLVTLSLSLLSVPEAMIFSNEAEVMAQIRPFIDGLILADGPHQALFLPAVWSQLPDPAQFLAHLKVKAGLGPTHWSPTVTLSRFVAKEFHEK